MFKYVNGRLGRTLWNLGKNDKRGKAYAIDTQSKTFCGATKFDREVQLLGKGTFAVNLFENPEHCQDMRRANVPAGSVFIIPKSRNSRDGNPTLYAAVGQTDDGEVVSVNLSTHEQAFGSGDSSAKIVGTFGIETVEAG
jgi:hypothetical protein